MIGVLLKNPDYCRLILEKITPADFLTDFNREIFRVICERLAQNRSVELIALSEQLSEEQMGKVAGILADPASSRQRPKRRRIIWKPSWKEKGKKHRSSFGRWTADSWNNMWRIWRRRRNSEYFV